MTMRVVLADDHPALILGMRAVLEADGKTRVTGEAGTPEDLLETLRRVECDVLVMDYSMPDDEERGGRDGLCLLRAVRGGYPTLPIVVFTMLRGAGLVDLVIGAGANGVLCKRDPIERLPGMLRLVAAGHTLVHPVPVKHMRTGRSDTPGERGSPRCPSLRRLSPRETEVVRLLVAGRSLREVATCLNRSAKTISHQKRSAMHKLGLRNDIDLARFAIDAGLAGG
ncbi:response regulator transcription factor [Robbsia sp. Bb-Pol-6]|uniref:Response regulator transcription factor n=1 Tax=Robbsia betulipollinis TaxID=2981849 RepID=A0ABT3ZU44_9BURK|nr:response regulator transcription factor [Robbsia betulipollinis]MCY0389762.1 response regulator transcription factor [Robbsia betulipollinis]